jgi:glyoxylase-like metal-dependent hydrolase (beta-lactamase superfamily II)
MEPEVFDAGLGLMVITYQTFVVRTPRYTILVDTCTGEDKGHPPPFDFPGKARWRNELFALGITYEQVDYVFCTHLHIDHTGWNTTLRDGRCADIPECEIHISQGGICRVGGGERQGRQPARDSFPRQLPADRRGRAGRSG